MPDMSIVLHAIEDADAVDVSSIARTPLMYNHSSSPPPTIISPVPLYKNPVLAATVKLKNMNNIQFSIVLDI